MRINYHPGLTVARKVGAAMSHLTLPEGVSDVSATTYHNCRENGLCFTFWLTGREDTPCGIEPVRVIVAEYRNSDSIVLYLGEDGERSLTARMYAAQVSCGCGNFAGAALRIVEHVTAQAKPKTERIRDGIKALLN